MPPKQRQEQDSVASRPALEKTVGNGTEKEDPTAIISLKYFMTLEMKFYMLCHVICFGIIMFAPGGVPILGTRGCLLRQHRLRAPKGKVKNAFDVFRNAEAAAKQELPVPYQMSSDLVLTLLFIFTANAMILVLLRNVMEFLQSHVTAEVSKENSAKRRACHEVVKEFLMNSSAVLCVLTAAGVLLQRKNQVRGTGPCLLLCSQVIFLCVLQAHGGVTTLSRCITGYQGLILIALMALVADANIFSDGLR